MSCSSKRKIAVGSCINTLVSSTKMRRCLRSRDVVRPRRVSGSSPLGMTSERLRGCEYFVRVARHFHLAPLLPQHSAAVDQERAALDTHVLAAVHALLLPDSEQLAHFLVLVGEQVEREFHLVLELLVRRDAVGRNAEHHCAGFLERAVQIAERLALQRAPGRVVLRIEVQDQVLAGGIRQLPGLAAGRRAAECRDFLVQGDGHAFTGSRIASRLSWSHRSMNSSRSAAMWILAGMCTTICTANIGAPV